VNWSKIIGLGVAGNFTGHLEQAGEAGDFLNVAVADAAAPKGIFPFYVPGPVGGTHFLHDMPMSSDRIRLSDLSENHQIEPEVALLCELSYQDNCVVDIIPRFAMAHNDCSIRRPGAPKISHKKNWGPESKGTSTQRIAIDSFREGGVLDRYRLACFLAREGMVYPYGVDSSLTGYSYFYGRLIDWLILQVNTQIDEGPLEDISSWLAVAEYPEHALISIGATRYTDYGETHFLEPGDDVLVAVYDGEMYDNAEIPHLATRPNVASLPGVSLLKQRVGFSAE
jgi:hypothetical protein